MSFYTNWTIIAENYFTGKFLYFQKFLPVNWHTGQHFLGLTFSDFRLRGISLYTKPSPVELSSYHSKPNLVALRLRHRSSRMCGAIWLVGRRRKCPMSSYEVTVVKLNKIEWKIAAEEIFLLFPSFPNLIHEFFVFSLTAWIQFVSVESGKRSHEAKIGNLDSNLVSGPWVDPQIEENHWEDPRQFSPGFESLSCICMCFRYLLRCYQ